MLNRESKSNNPKARKRAITAAALIAILAVTAAAILHISGFGYLTLENYKTGEMIAEYPVFRGSTFSIGFIHSVNKSPVTDCYELRDDGIYVVKTVYWGFGAGVQTEIEEGQTLEYDDDGSMIVTGFDKKIDQLLYIVGTVSDHTMTLNEKKEISLRDLCGRNTMVHFTYDRLI